MITVETIPNFTGKNKVIIILSREGKRVGKIYAKNFDCVSTKLGHFEKIYGERFVWEM